MQNLQSPPGNVFVQPRFQTTAVPIALSAMALQNTGLPTPAGTTVAGCNTALLTTGAAHGYTETLMPNGIKNLANATTGHGPTSFGGGAGQGTFTYFQIAGATGNTGVNGITVAALRVLSTTQLLIAMPVTGANPTVTAANLIPILIPAAGTYALQLGPNCEVAINPDNTGAPYQFSSQSTVAAPLWVQLLAPSTNHQIQFEGPAGQTIVRANGAAGTTYWSQYNR
jgi:hypothetical protein